MPTYQVNLNQTDIRQLIAERYEVELADVTVTVHRGFDGPANDNQPPSIEATVKLPQPPQPRR